MLLLERSIWAKHKYGLAVLLLGTIAASAVYGYFSQASGRWLGGGSEVGLSLGLIAALIMVFEALIYCRKHCVRTWRIFGSAQNWMIAHIWLGFLTVPLVVLHCGFAWGGWLTCALLAIFFLVIASGVWGLWMQNLIPKVLLEYVPLETVYSQINAVGRQYAADVWLDVEVLCNPDPDAKRPVPRSEKSAVEGKAREIGTFKKLRLDPGRKPPPRLSPEDAAVLSEKMRCDVVPFLTDGKLQSGVLGTRQRNQWYFADLRESVPAAADYLTKFEQLCERRLQLNMQQKLHYWLHNWAWLHLSLTIMLLALLVCHIVSALLFYS